MCIRDSLSDEADQQFIFLTGAAGTGKTTLLERVKNQLSLKKMVVAPTGIAALNIGGTTINSAFRIGFDTIPNITKSKDPRFAKLLRNLELLIIDEVSMVRSPMMDAISQSLQIHRNSEAPFGGVHVLACGDLFQLPPIIKESEERIIYEKYDSVYFFDSHSFKDMMKISFFELTESFRQEEDQRFCDLLNNIRVGNDLENTIRAACEPIFDQPMEKINFGEMLLFIFDSARRFDLRMQPSLMLLQKTLVNIEGMGKQLYPALDFWSIANPFLKNWISERYNPKKLTEWAKKNSLSWLEKARKLPEIADTAIEQVSRLEEYQVANETRHKELMDKLYVQGRFNGMLLIVFIILIIFLIGS